MVHWPVTSDRQSILFRGSRSVDCQLLKNLVSARAGAGARGSSVVVLVVIVVVEVIPVDVVLVGIMSNDYGDDNNDDGDSAVDGGATVAAAVPEVAASYYLLLSLACLTWPVAVAPLEVLHYHLLLVLLPELGQHCIYLSV